MWLETRANTRAPTNVLLFADTGEEPISFDKSTIAQGFLRRGKARPGWYPVPSVSTFIPSRPRSPRSLNATTTGAQSPSQRQVFVKYVDNNYGGTEVNDIFVEILHPFTDQYARLPDRRTWL